MDKLKFEFMQKSASDGKSNFLALTSISTIEDKTFCMPDCYQDVSHHTELMKNAAFIKVTNSIKQRHQTRRVWIKLDEILTETYLDEGNNVQFKDYFLEEIEPSYAEKKSSC